jgi:hypothetical protein
MTRTKWLVLLVAASMAAVSASCQSRRSRSSSQTQGSGQASQARPIKAVREAAVAGLFYPKDAAALGKLIEALLANVKEGPIENLRGLICPHAGYEFSGQTAAVSYKLLVGRDVKTAVVLAPSHYCLFEGAFLPRTDAYRTPLGLVPLSPKADELAKVSPFTSTPQCRVERPGWWRQSPMTAPADGQDLPDTWEHAVEVQVPFLQRVLKDFTLVPVIYGNVDPAEVAKAIEPVLDDKTIVIASSDLSHFYPYDEARKLDDRCLTAVCTLDIERMKDQEACGKAPIQTLMHLAKSKGWRARFLDYRNSGDTAGDKNRVVGYGAIAFYAPAKAAQDFSPEERKWMLQLARKALRESVAAAKLPPVDTSNLSPRLTRELTEPKGCFVTLTKDGSLRGCIGHILPQEPLSKAIMDNAQNAALRDPRFLPVQAVELDKIKIEISILTTPEPLYFKDSKDLLDRLQPGKDGVILKIGDRMATYLPQVWDQIPDKQKFLDSLAVKAGCQADAWKTGPTTILIYHVEAFKEPEK